MKTLKVTTICLFTLLLLVTNTIPVIAASGDQEKLEEVQRKLEELRREKKSVKSQYNSQKSLSNKYGSEIVSLNNEIKELQLAVEEKALVIDELNLKIKIVEQQIKDTEDKITQAQNNIQVLQKETDKRLADMYLDIKSFDNSMNMIFASDGNADFIKDGLYREAIQEDTNSKLDRLSLEKSNLEKDKEQLTQDRIQVETDKSLLEEERKALESNQTMLAQKRSKYQSMKSQSDTAAKAIAYELETLSDSEKRLLAEQELLKQRIFNSVNSIPNGMYVKAGTIIGFEGSTGVSTGPHLHFGVSINGSTTNPCSALPNKKLANATCGVANPKVSKWPMGGTPWLTSGYRTSSRPTHNAIDISSGGSAAIYAAHDGYITYGNDGACSWYKGSYPCNGAGANYAIICQDKKNCNNGLKTLYFHLR